METELLLRIVAIIIATMLLFTNISIKPVLDKVKKLFTFQKNKVETILVDKKESVDFLEIVDLWYKLKNKCEAYKLKSAVEQLDKVFPLLNIGEKNV